MVLPRPSVLRFAKTPLDIFHDDHHLSLKMTIVIKKMKANHRCRASAPAVSWRKGNIMPVLTPRLHYPSGKAARQVAFARRFVPRALFDKILRPQFGLA